MEKIRKGNDITVLWEIYAVSGGTERPYDLSGRNLTLYLRSPFGKEKVQSYSIEANTIRFTFYGKDQSHIGKYSLTLVENEGVEGMHTLDECDAFELVSCSCKAGGEPESKVEMIILGLKGTMTMAAGMVEIDDYLSTTSKNAVQNKVITAALEKKAEQSAVPTKTSQLKNDSSFITKNEVPDPDWNASTYKEGHIKNRTHHMQDHMCHYFKGSPIKVSKPSGVGYVLLAYDTDLADKFIRIDIKADESKTHEFLDAMGMPLIFRWDAGNSTINVESFAGAVEAYGMRAYYSSSAKSYDEYFVSLDDGFIPESVARKSEIAELAAGMVEIDDYLSTTSKNAVQNKVITAALEKKAEQSAVPTKTSQLKNDSSFITKNEVPDPDWNASTYKEGHIKNRTHHMQDHMCHYFKGSPIKVSKPSGVGYVLLAYDTDLADKFIRIDIKADESKTHEFLDAMGMPLIFRWDAGNSTINVESFAGAVEAYGMRAYYSSSAKSYDEYFVSLDDGFIPESVARKSEIAELAAEIEVLKEAQQFTDVAVKDLQDMKIDRENDDYYPKMAVGLADNLAGVDVVDSYINFRRSGGGAITDGVARIESIKGNSVVWNQLNNPSLTPYVAQWLSVDGESYVVTKEVTSNNWLALSQGIAWKMGHYYYYNFGTTGSPTSGFYVQINDKTIRPSVPQIIQSPADASSAPTLRIEAGNVGIQFKIQAIDLTKMFGAGNEPTTIEEFYQRIPMGVDLNAYNEGEVIHMDVQSIESGGRNQWDEEWELGRYSTSTGEPSDATTGIRNTNPIRVQPNTTYYGFGTNVFGLFYDAEDKIITLSDGRIYQSISNRTFTTPAAANYMRFYQVDVPTYNHDICINLSDTSINGKYYPYIKRVEDLSIIRKYFPQGMKSAGSAHDEIRYNKASGKWEKVQRIGEVDMGSLAWSNFETLNGLIRTKATYTPFKGGEVGQYAGLLCEKFPTAKGDTSMSGAEELGIFGLTNNRVFLLAKEGTYANIAEFKAAMAGVILYYELAEPIVTELDEADQFKDLDYQVWNAGTEKAIAEGKSAPLAADITYGFNAVGKIKELESLVAQLRAKVGI